MTTPIEGRDLTEQSPHSPRDRFGDFAILGRTVDKCYAKMAGNPGDYHYDSPLDDELFRFKGVNGEQFQTAVAAADSYEEVVAWLKNNGTKKSPEEIKAWSDRAEKTKMKELAASKNAEHRQELADNCRKMGLDFETVTLFEWLETDDRASFQTESASAAH